MKKALTFLFILIAIQSMAQKQEIGIRSGLHYDVHTFTGDNDMFQQYLDGLKPSAGIFYSRTNEKGLFWETGLAYRSVTLNPNLYTPYRYTMLLRMETIYSIISIPVHIGYSFDISEKLNTKISMGADVGYNIGNDNISISNTFTAMDNTTYIYSIVTRNKIEKQLNLYLSNSIELRYKTKWGLRPGIFCTYHAGLFNTWKTNSAYIKTINLMTGEDTYYGTTISGRGSALLFGLQASWVF
ncbi:MAG: hypothetical protein ACQES1_09875 [Bacteroidota bacterium]